MSTNINKLKRLKGGIKMTLEQCEQRNKAIINNAIKWAYGKDCDPLYQIDLAVISEYLNINTPKCIYNFVQSDNCNQCRAYSSHKSILKFMDKIKNKIIQGELDKFVS